MGKEWFIMYSSLRWVAKRPRRFAPMGKFRFSLLTKHKTFVIDGLPFRGLFVAEVRTPHWSPVGRPGAVLERRERPSVKKIKVSENRTVKHLAAMETEVFLTILPLLEFLAMLQYEDGTPRQPGYVGIWTSGSVWTIRLTDKDADATLTAEGRTLDEAVGLACLLLGADDAPWEPNGRKKGRR